MDTKPASNDAVWLWLGILAAAVLFVIALLPKTGFGEELALGLGFMDILLLIGIVLGAALPRIKRSQLGCLVQGFLGVAAVTGTLVGAVLLTLFACSAGR